MMETTSPETKPSQEAWEAVAEKIYEKMMDGHIENVAHVHSIFEEEKEFSCSLLWSKDVLALSPFSASF